MTISPTKQIQVEAPRAQLIGTTAAVNGQTVLYVNSSASPAVQHRKYVADYSRRSDRPWKVGKRSFASLPNAIRALQAEQSAPAL